MIYTVRVEVSGSDHEREVYREKHQAFIRALNLKMTYDRDGGEWCDRLTDDGCELTWRSTESENDSIFIVVRSIEF